MTPQSRLPIGCIIKPLLALATLEMFVQGHLDIHAPVEDYLPELRGGGEVTIAQLLSHTGGFMEPRAPDARWKLDWQEFVPFFKNRRQVFERGTVFSYTQTGHAIVSRILARVADRDVDDILRELIFEPLGLNLDDPARATGVGHVFARGGWMDVRLPKENSFFAHSISPASLSSEEMISIATLIGGGRPGIVSDRAYALFSKPVCSIPPTWGGDLKEATPSAYGLGLGIYGDLVGHSGSYVSSCCALRFHRETQSAVAVGVNAWAPGARDLLLREAYRRAVDPALPGPEPAAVPPAPLEAYVGRYECLMLGLGEAEMSILHGQFVCDMHFPGQSVRVILSQDDKGRLHGRSQRPNVALGLAMTADTGAPYIQSGLCAYAKVG